MNGITFKPAKYDFIATGGYKMPSGNIRAFRFKVQGINLESAGEAAVKVIQSRKTYMDGITLSVCYA